MAPTHRGVLLVLVLALAAIATLFWLVGSGATESSGPGSSPPSTGKRDEVGRPDVGREPPADASSSVRSEVAAPAPAPAIAAGTEPLNSELASVKGQVVDEEDAAIAGVAVEVWASDVIDLIPGTFEQRSLHATTGPDGAFTVAALNPEHQLCLRVRLTRHDDIELDLPRLRPGANELGKLVAKLGGVLVGRLVDEHGAQVAGAKITARMHLREGSVPDVFPHERTANTDERGEFRIEGLRPGMCSVTASTGSNAVSQDQITIVKGKPTDPIELRLQSGLKLEGTVRDSRGEPVAGARLSLYPIFKGTQAPRGGADRKAETGTDGRFEFQDLLEVSYRLFLYADGFLDLKDILRPSQDPIEIVVHRPGLVVGRVRAAESAAPVSQFGVTFYQRGGDGILAVNRSIKALTGQPALEHAGTTDTAGLFVIKAPPSTNVAVKISADGFADTTHGPFDVPAEQRVDVTIDLKRETTVAGVVLDANDEGVAEAQVTIRPKGDQRARFRPGTIPHGANEKSVTSQAGGLFKIGGLSAGDVTLEASHEGSVASEPVELRLRPQSTVSGVELKLRAAGALEGQALDADSKPLPRGNVVLTPEGAGSASELTAKTSVDGRFTFRGLAPGRYYAELKSPSDSGAIPLIVASPPGPDGRPIGTLVTIEPDETTEVTLTLARKASLSGVVTAAGRPLEGAVVSVPVSVFAPSTVQTKADGRFAFGELEPHEWTVSVRAPGAALTIERAASCCDPAKKRTSTSPYPKAPSRVG
ncbi:MAG: carboxypeptidase-like regulatory domain-containing protein [Planctomycetota bacterium]